jgi:hypothetical protein
MKPKRGVFSLRGWLYWQLRVLPDKDDVKDVFKSLLDFLDEMTSDTESSIGISSILFGICFMVVSLTPIVVGEVLSISVDDYAGYIILLSLLLSFLSISLMHYLLYVYKAELKEKNDETQSR